MQRPTSIGATVRFALLCLALALTACDNGKPSFKNTDVTGADFGKDFALTDHTGKPRSLADFRGKVVTIFFGFTQCPDVCPSTLAEMKAVLEKLGPADAKRVQVLFVTIDPERDTPEVLRPYMASFDPSFVALRGTPEQTAAAAKDFKIYYAKAGQSAAGYTIDHTAGSVVIDPQGRARLFVRYGAPADDLTQDVRALLKEG